MLTDYVINKLRAHPPRGKRAFASGDWQLSKVLETNRGIRRAPDYEKAYRKGVSRVWGDERNPPEGVVRLAEVLDGYSRVSSGQPTAVLPAPAFRSTPKRRRRTGNPYNDALVGVEPNPGPKPGAGGKGNKGNSYYSKPTGKPFRPGLAARKAELAITKAEQIIESKMPIEAKPKLKAIKMRRPGPAAAVVSTGSYVPTFDTTCWTRLKARSGTTIRIHGKQRINSVNLPSATTSGLLLESINITESMFDATQLGKYFASYERWTPHRLHFTLLPRTTSTNAPGSYFMYVEPDGQDAVWPGTLLDINSIANQQSVPEVSAWGVPGTCTRLRDKTDQDLYTSGMTVNPTAIPNADPRLYTAGQFLLVAGEGLPTSVPLGTLYVEFDIEFKQNIESFGPTVVAAGAFFPNTTASNANMRLFCEDGANQLVQHSIEDMVGSAITWKASVASTTVAVAAYAENGLTNSLTAGNAGSRPSCLWQLPAGEYFLRATLNLTSVSSVTELVPPLLTLANTTTATSLTVQVNGDAVTYPKDWTNPATNLLVADITNIMTPSLIAEPGAAGTYEINAFDQTMGILSGAPLGDSHYRSVWKSPLNFTKAYSYNGVFRIGMTPNNARNSVFNPFSFGFLARVTCGDDIFIQGFSYELVRISVGPSRCVLIGNRFPGGPSVTFRSSLSKDECKQQVEGVPRAEEESKSVPDSPIVVENPMTHSLHIPRSMLTQLLGKK